MKKILFLLLISAACYGQADFPEGINLGGNTATAETSKLVSQQPGSGTLNYVNATALPISTAVQDSLNKKLNLPTGFLQGLQLSINADPTKFNIAAGYYVVTDFTNLAIPIVKIISYAGATGLTPAYLATSNSTYIALDKNQNVISSASPFTDAQRRTLAIIGNVVHSNHTTINVTNELKAPIIAIGNQLHDFMKAIGFLNESGNIYSPNGANLQIDKSAGDIWGMGINSSDYTQPHKLTIAAQTALTFAYRISNGTQYADTNNIDPNNYEVAGALTSIPGGTWWTIQRINLFQSGITRVQYGQNLYSSFNAAVSGLPLEPFTTEQNIADNAVFRCYLIVQKGVTNLTSAVAAGTARFVPVDKFGNVIGSGSVPLTYANIIAALGYTPENQANKSDIYTVSSSTTYASTAALVGGLGTKANIESPAFTGTVSGITKSMVGLSNIDNTSDLNKPVSTATQTALDLKANLSAVYTQLEVDSKIANLNEAYHVDFIDSGSHTFTIPEDIIIQNVYLNNIPVYGADWSQTNTTVSVTTALTGDKVTLTGGSFVKNDFTNYVKKETGKNLFNKDDATNIDLFYLNGGGGTSSDPYSMVTHYIPILAGQTIYCNNAWDGSGVHNELTDVDKLNQVMVACDASKKVTATVDGFVRFSLRFYPVGVQTLDNTQVENGSAATSYAPYTFGIPKNDIVELNESAIPSNIARVVNGYTELKCKRYGTVGVDCDYTGLNAIKDALESITDASASKRYKIIFDGHFYFNIPSDIQMQERDGIFSNEYSAVVGKDWVDIEGIGKNQSIIAVQFTTGTTFTGGHTYQDYQPVMWHCNSKLSNCQLIAKNARYALHTDWGENKDIKFTMENVKFVHLGNDEMGDIYSDAIGTGIGDSQEWTFKNCEIINKNASAFGVHSGFGAILNGGKINFIDCIFDSAYIHTDVYPNNTVSHINFVNPIYKQKTYISYNYYYSTRSISSDYSEFKISSNGLTLPISTQSFNGLGKYRGQGLRVVPLSASGYSYVRFDNSCTAFNSIIGNGSDGFEFELEDFSKSAFGYKYKDGDSGIKGYALGGIDIDDQTSHTSLGKKLGNCTSVNKTLTIIVDGVTRNVVFNTDLTSTSNTDILAIINGVIGDIGIADCFSAIKEFFPDFAGTESRTNTGGSVILKGMAVVFNGSNSMRVATNSDGRIDGICLDVSLIGGKCRVIKKGDLSSYYLKDYYNAYILDVSGATVPQATEFGISTSSAGYFDRTASPKVAKAYDTNLIEIK